MSRTQTYEPDEYSALWGRWGGMLSRRRRGRPTSSRRM